MSPLNTQKQGLRTKMQIAALSLVLATGHICAQERNYDIQPQSLSQALRDYARASSVQLIFTEDLVRGRTAPPLQGEFTEEEALNRLLEGSGLRAEKTPAGAVMIARIGDDAQAPDTRGQGQSSAATDSGRDTYEFDIPSQDMASALRAFSRTTRQQVVFDRAEVRGKSSAPLRGTYTADEGIEILLTGTGLEVRRDPQGRLRVEEAVRVSDVPTEPEPVTEIERIAVTGTSIRGIAPDSSPVRIYTSEDIQISGAATAQDFIQTLTANFGGGSNANIPGLPTDSSAGGNSASFGSFGSSVNLRGLGSGSTLVLLNGHRLAPASFNANFVDISMIPASAIERVEILTDGASSIYGSDAVAGVVNFILRDDFEGLETSLRAGTGTQHRTPDQYRGSVTGGQNWGSGHALIVYEFFDQEQLSVENRDFAAKDFAPSYLLPSQKRHSVLASAAQEVTSNFELFADFTYSSRDARQLRTNISGNSFQRDATSENVSIAAGGALQVFSDWFLDFSGAYSKVDTRNITSLFTDGLRVLDSDMWTADAILSGSLFHLPGGEVKLAFGGQYRTESFQAENKTTDTVDREAPRDVYALFGEVFIPIVGPENRVPGIERLELNASGRYSDYSDFGSTTDPKVGLLWSPLNGLNFRGTYSTSFKAPPLGRVGDKTFAAQAFRTSFLNAALGLTAPDPSLADVVELIVFGTGKDLGPETSTAFTAGLDFQQQWASHSFTASATWFDIDFEGRLGQTPIPGGTPFADAINIAFVDPDAFPPGTVVFSPTAAQIRAVLDSVDRFSNPFGDDPFDAAAINFAGVVRNLSRTRVSGIDFDLSYTHELGNGSLLLGLDGTFLQDFKQQAASTTPVVEQLNTLFNPVDLKLRARAGYSADNLTGNVFLNYVDSYHVDSTLGSTPIDSWTTVDVSLAYDTKERLGNSFLNNTVFRISAINIFDEDPPQAPINPIINVDGFDPTNASPLGRFISFEIIKRW